MSYPHLTGHARRKAMLDRVRLSGQVWKLLRQRDKMEARLAQLTAAGSAGQDVGQLIHLSRLGLQNAEQRHGEAERHLRVVERRLAA